MGLKAKLTTKTPCECVLTGHADRENLDDSYEKVYAKMSKDVTLPGFRKGCAPRSLVETHYREHFRAEALENIMSSIIRSVITKQRLKISGSIHPQEEYEFPTEGDFDFTVEFEVHPVVKLTHVEGIKLVKNVVKIEDKDIESKVKQLCENHATFADVETTRPIAFGDWVVVDFTGLVEGENVFSRNDVWLEINSQMQYPIAGFAKELVGSKQNETCTFSITAPPDYHMKNICGKTVHFTVKIKELKEKKIPKLTDEIAAKIDPKCTTAGELRDKIRKNYAEYQQKEEHARLQQLAREKLAELNPTPLPPTIVRDKAKRILQELIETRMQGGEDEETIKQNLESLQKDAEENAIRMLRAEYILATLAKRENILVEIWEITPQIEYYSHLFKRPPMAIYEQFKRDGYIPHLMQDVRELKALNWVVERADIQEKS